MLCSSNSTSIMRADPSKKTEEWLFFSCYGASILWGSGWQGRSFADPDVGADRASWRRPFYLKVEKERKKRTVPSRGGISDSQGFYGFRWFQWFPEALLFQRSRLPCYCWNKVVFLQMGEKTPLVPGSRVAAWPKLSTKLGGIHSRVKLHKW